MKMKKVLCLVLALVMLIGLLPTVSLAAPAEGETKTLTQESNSATMAVLLSVPEKTPVSYIDANGEEQQTGTDYNYVRSTIVKWGTVDTETWYVVDEDVTIAERIVVSGRVNLILCDGATLTANKGITFASNEYSLTVYGQTKGTGALVAAGGNDQAGIGGGSLYDDVGSVGTVTINGGTVTATGGENAAGIGGGIETDGNTVTINGGTVTATGGNKGAGIGGGSYCGGGTVNINGGTVTAITSGEDPGAAIGAGYSGSGCTIRVSEGMTAVAGNSAGTAQETAADKLGYKKWAYIEKSEPLTAVSYLDENGEAKTLDPAATTYTRVKPYTETWTDGWYVVDKSVTISGQVNVSGNAKLILCDGATLTVEKQLQCISIRRSLAIYGQTNGTGTLRIKGDNVGMILGQENNVIYGGTLDVSGVSQAISVTSMGQFTIAGGTVNAAASRDTGTGIDVSSSATLTIEGGVVTASGRGKAINVFNEPGIGYGTLNIAPNMAAQAGADEQSAVEVETLSGTSYKYAQIKAAEPKTAVKYIDENGEEQTTTDYFTVNANTKFATDKFYVVSEDVEFEDRITPAADHVKLILADGKTMTAKGFANTGSKILSIYGQSEGTGTLSARGNGGAAIGGNDHEAGGTVNIYGGSVNATGSNSGAGIGGGNEGAGGTVNIYGGTVTATGGKSAAGIGGGYKGNGGTVTINGGTVTATGGVDGAGIGGGSRGNGGTVTITGGTVTATGGENGAGIGHGAKVNGDGTLTITGLQVKAGSAATDTIMPNAAFLEGFGTYRWVSIGRFHLHTLTGYALSKTNAKDDTISATCTEDLDNCPLAESEYKATMTITASGEGGGKATLTGGAADFGLTDADIAYTKNGAAITADEITDTGFYTASITAGEKTASITYGVNEVKKDPAFNAADAHGDFTVPAVATADALVTIETTPDTGYELKAISVKKADNSAVTSAVNGNSGTFTMPAETVTVSVEFKLHDYTISKSEMTNGSVAVAGTAKMGDTVSLTITPATGYELDTLSVTDSASAALTVTDGAFTMPADDVNIAATFKLHDYTISKSETENGSIAVAGTAKMGDSVEVTVTPDAGYLLDSLTYNGAAITETEGKYTFTMPAADVAVAAAFAARDVDVTFAAAADEETGSAELLTEEFAPVSESFTRKIGERFVLRVTCAEDCDYVVKFNNDRALAETSMEEFTAEEYKRYAEFLEDHGSTIPTRTDLFWITMPGVAANVDALDITAALAKTKSFTILYKPATAQEGPVWCKFTDSEGNAFAAEMKNDLNVGGINVWSVRAMSAFVPSGVAFSDSLEALANAAVTDCTGKVNANWSAISGGEYRVIGGNAKTVAAAFVDESASEKSRETMTADAIGASAIYEVGVCSTDDLGAVTAPGTVKAPGALSKEGFTFRGWRGFKYDAKGKASEQIYQPGADVPVYGNVTLSAVWSPVILNVAINPNNGAESYNIPTTYGDPVLRPEDIERAGFVLQNWAVGKNVTESGEFLPRGSVFDFSTGITSDLALNASWKHVHCYTCVPLNYSGFNGALDAYSKYFQYLHVKFCACGDVALEAHTYKNGLCTTCGYAKPGAEQVQLEVSHWKQGASSSWMEELPRTAKRGEEVTVSAYWQIGDWQFSKWQYSTDSGATWEDLAADTMVGFLIPCSMKVRAIYVSTIHDPQITLSARNYVTQAQGYNWDTVLFQMEYKLPEGYTLVDAGIRMGDNAGISYYEMKEIKATTGQKAAVIGTKFGMNMIPFVGGGLTGFLTDMTMDAISGDEPQYYYEKRENSVLDEMTAATLSEYMMKSKPVNVEKYPPIYWEAAAKTKGRSGSVNTLTPLSFIQKNNGNHYIYGMAYLTYKDSSGKTHTIYTEALPTTRDQIPSYSVKATPNGMTNTQQH